MTQDQKPKRRWFRYSLRTLLLLVGVAGAGFGWLGYKVRQIQQQKGAIEAINKLGGRVHYDCHVDSDGNLIDFPTPVGPVWLRKLMGDESLGNVVGVNLSDAKVIGDGPSQLQGLNQVKWLALDNPYVTNADLVHLRRLTKIEALSLRTSQITDAGLVHLQGFTKLERLYLNDTQVTDAGLVFLRRLNQIRELDLCNTKVSNAGLIHLQALTQLRKLFLGKTQITDVGLIHLEGLSQLEELDLNNTQVTDAGLSFLAGLNRLQWLQLGITPVTDAGCDELQKALPNLEIVR